MLKMVCVFPRLLGDHSFRSEPELKRRHTLGIPDCSALACGYIDHRKVPKKDGVNRANLFLTASVCSKISDQGNSGKEELTWTHSSRDSPT